MFCECEYEMLYESSNNQGIYSPREPRKNYYYRCVEENFEVLERVWDDRYQSAYGYWRPHILDVIYDYLDCGNLDLGFARVKCEDCNKEYLLPFSCKRRAFCPSCHQRRESPPKFLPTFYFYNLVLFLILDQFQ